MEPKALLILVMLCCWCLVSQRAHATRLDELRNRFIDKEIESETQRKRRPLSSLSRGPEHQDYHFAAGIFRKRMFNAGEQMNEDPWLLRL